MALEEWKLRLTSAKVEIEVEADLGKTKKKGANISEQGGKMPLHWGIPYKSQKNYF